MSNAYLARLFFVSMIAVCQAGHAQERNAPKYSQLQGDVAALKQDVRALGAQQIQILDQLNELKQLLAANANRPNQPPLPSTLAIQHELFRGDAAARIAIVEYADYECPYCGKHMSETYPQILENYIRTGKVRHIFRDLPLPMHSHAMPAARAARCAGEQDKYWEMHDSLFADQRSLLNPALLDRAAKLSLDTAKFDECLSSTRHLDDVRNSMAEAQKLGIGGTPMFFLGTIDGDVVNIAKAIRGAVPYETFKAALDELLAKAEH